MSRINWVRSSTRQGNAASRLRSWVGGKVVIEEHQVGFGGSGDPGNLFYLTGANKGSRVGPGATLQKLGGHNAAGTGNQLPEFSQGFLNGESCETGSADMR